MSLTSGRSALKAVLPLVSSASAAPSRLPWAAESATQDAPMSADKRKELREEFERKAMLLAAPAAAPATAPKIEGVMYDVWIGANVKVFSSAENETKLRAMRTENHWDLPISRMAARVADFLWPDCQTVVDHAMAESKIMRNTRGISPDDVYMAPKVPEFLPITHWVATNKNIRDSFVSDRTTAIRPRMSWYNPNDGMVPSDWLTQGLIADLAYYRPFAACTEKK